MSNLYNVSLYGYFYFCNFRRKKKCIRLLIQQHGHSSMGQDQDSKHSSSKNSITKDEAAYHKNAQQYPQRMLDPNPSINELRRLIPTIGRDSSSSDRHESSSFSKVIHSPADSTSRSTGGFETNSDNASIRSPSGISSFPSIGSPVHSIASPHAACSYYDGAPIPINILSNANCGSGGGSIGAAGDWFRQNNHHPGHHHHSAGLPSAFKPLSSTATSVISPPSISPHFQVTSSPKRFGETDLDAFNGLYTFSANVADVGHHSLDKNSTYASSLSSFSNSIMNLNGNTTLTNVIRSQQNNQSTSNNSNNHRTRVGADPRDAKNPLSISQLTGNTNANDQLHVPTTTSSGSGRHFMSKNFMRSNGTVITTNLVDGLPDISKTHNRNQSSRKNSSSSSVVSENMHRMIRPAAAAERTSTVLV